MRVVRLQVELGCCGADHERLCPVGDLAGTSRNGLVLTGCPSSLGGALGTAARCGFEARHFRECAAGREGQSTEQGQGGQEQP